MTNIKIAQIISGPAIIGDFTEHDGYWSVKKAITIGVEVGRDGKTVGLKFSPFSLLADITELKSGMVVCDIDHLAFSGAVLFGPHQNVIQRYTEVTSGLLLPSAPTIQ